MDNTTTEKPSTKEKNAKLALFLAIVGALGTLAVFPYSLTINSSLISQIPVPIYVFVVAQVFQTGILLFLLSWLGLHLSSHLGLDVPFVRAIVYRMDIPPISRYTLSISAIAGATCGLIIMGLDLAFRPFMPPPLQSGEMKIELWKRALASLYGGITEELLIRLFLTTLFAWLIWKFAFKSQKPISPIVFWIAISLAAIIFGVGHLPAAAAIWTLTPLVVTRVIILNAIGGMVFGFIYWRWGLEHAMVAHFCADIVLHVIGGS